ncbi:MAG: exosome complex exonuclease Rrp41 [Candidatus Aenigmatarchaeota archaeon]|nr:exosome complex exonuclease Rrp41 [Candidatus Aenigmarchaeota archaeon]
MSKKVGAPEALIVDGKRLDGRSPNEFRPINIEIGTLKRANGSAEFRFGNTYALAGVMGPRPFHPKALQDPQRSIVRVNYAMAPFSTKERSKPGKSRRSTEISKVINEALANVIFAEDYPRTGIDLFLVILQADASTRCAALNAASLALADAGVPIRDLVVSCSVGKVDGTLILDVAGLEDNFGDVDMAVATIANQDKIVLLQMDGIITKEEFMTLIDMAKKGCGQIYDMMKAKLYEKYVATPAEEGA